MNKEYEEVEEEGNFEARETCEEIAEKLKEIAELFEMLGACL